MINLIPKLNSLFIFLLIITMIGGSYLVVCYIGGIEFAAYRFVLAFAVIYLLLTRQLKLFKDRFTKYVLFVFLIWIVYGAISLLWAPSLRSGIQELFYIVIGFTSYMVFFSLYNAEKEPRRTLEKYWNIGFLVVSGFLVFEMLTQLHLEGEYFRTLNSLGDFHRANFIPIFTFVNPNVLAIYLCISIIFAGNQVLQNRSRVLNVAIVLIAFDFLILTESRLGLLCVIGILLSSVLLLFFRTVRKQISFFADKKQLVAILILVAFNCLIAGLEFKMLDSDKEIRFSSEENRISAALKSKHDRYLEKEGVVLLLSDPALEKKQEKSPDKVFAIEQNAYLKLLDGRKTDLQLKKVNPDVSKSLFYGKNKTLILIFTIFFFLILISWMIKPRSERSDLLFLAGSVTVFVIVLLSGHVYDHSSPEYKQLVLAEPSFESENLAVSDLYIVSASSVTGHQLKSGEKTGGFLYSRQAGANPEDGRLSSGSVRKNLILNGFEYLRSSRFMGTGAGGYRENNLRKLNKYPDNGVGGAHNFVIEILSQYGVIVFLLLFAVIIAICYRLFLGLKAKKWDEKHFVVLWLMIALGLMGNSNSSFLSLPVNWFLVIFMLIFAGELMDPLKVTDETKH